MNPFHYRELDPDELAALLDAAGFEISRLLGLRHGPRLRGTTGALRLAGATRSWPDRRRPGTGELRRP